MRKFEPHQILKETLQKTRGGYYYIQTDSASPSTEHPPDRGPRCYLHIALMENKLKRYLKKNEDVHHKDGNPSNNSLDNLELVKHDDHQIEHAKKKKFWKKSPMNKPGRKAALRVISNYFQLT